MKAGKLELRVVEDHIAAIEQQGVAAIKKAIALLTKKLKGRDPKKDDEDRQRCLERFWSSFGAWEGDGTAEELASSIRNARTINPDREPL